MFFLQNRRTIVIDVFLLRGFCFRLSPSATTTTTAAAEAAFQVRRGSSPGAAEEGLEDMCPGRPQDSLLPPSPRLQTFPQNLLRKSHHHSHGEEFFIK